MLVDFLPEPIPGIGRPMPGPFQPGGGGIRITNPNLPIPGPTPYPPFKPTFIPDIILPGPPTHPLPISLCVHIIRVVTDNYMF